MRFSSRMESAVAPPVREPWAAHASLALVVAVWAGSFPAIKALLDGGTAATDVALLRYLVAAPGFAALLWHAGGLPGLTRREAARLAVAGVLVVALSPTLTLVLASALLRERASGRRVAGLAVALAGVAVVVLLGAGGELSPAGVKGPLIVLGAPLSFALYNVLLQPLLACHGVLALTAASSLLGTVALLPLARASTVDAVGEASAGDVALVLYLGLVCTLAGYAAWNVGLRGLGSTRAVAYTYAIPVVAVSLGALLLDEPVTVWLAVGGRSSSPAWRRPSAPGRERRAPRALATVCC